MAGLTHRVLGDVLPQGVEALRAENVVCLSGLSGTEAGIYPAPDEPLSRLPWRGEARALQVMAAAKRPRGAA